MTVGVGRHRVTVARWRAPDGLLVTQLDRWVWLCECGTVADMTFGTQRDGARDGRVHQWRAVAVLAAKATGWRRLTVLDVWCPTCEAMPGQRCNGRDWAHYRRHVQLAWVLRIKRNW